MSGRFANGELADQPVIVADSSKPRIHMNSFAINALGDLIVWKEHEKETHAA